MTRLRVLLVSRAFLVGAYQPKLEEIAQHGVDLLTVVPPRWREPGRVQELERVNVDGYRLEVEPIALNGRFHLHFYPRLRRRFAEFRPHVLHIDEEPYNVATGHAVRLARRYGTRVVGFTWQNLDRRYPQPFRALQAYVLARTDHFLAGSVEAGAVLRAKGYRGPVTVLPQVGVDESEFHPSPGPRAPGAFVIGYAGRLVEEKGVDLLVRAAARLPADTRLDLVGAGAERDRLVALAGELGLGARCTVTPWIASTAMPAWLRSLDVLVLPSRTRANWKEQFGRVLVEAMACGVPVVGAASGEIPNVIGDAGIVFAEDDLAGLTDALARLEGDTAERARLGARGRARVLARYTHARIAEETVAVYRAVTTRTPWSGDRTA